MEKPCTRCGQVKPLSEFHKCNCAKDGRQGRCKACACEVARAHYQKRKQQPVQLMLELHADKRCSVCGKIKLISEFHKEQIYPDGHAPRCKECASSANREWKHKHADHVREINKQWRDNNRDHMSDYHKQWYAANRDYEIARVAKWRKTPIGKISETHSRHKRRAAKKDSDITPEWLGQLYSIQSHCAYCGQEFGDDLSPTLDHITPLSKGGTHTKDNVILACLSCNASKNDSIIDIACIDLLCVSQLREFLGELLGHPIQELL